MANFQFYGNSKKTLYQSYGRTDKVISNKDTTRKATEERQIREHNKKLNKSATIIRNVCRSHVYKHKLREELKEEIDMEINKSIDFIPNLFCLMTRFIYAHNLRNITNKEDSYYPRLLLISSQMIKNSGEIGKEIMKNKDDNISMKFMVTSIKRVLALCMGFISRNASHQDISMDVPLQLIKEFTCLNTYMGGQRENNFKEHALHIVADIMDHLFNNEYYSTIKSLIDNKLQITSVDYQNEFINDIFLFDNLNLLPRSARSTAYQRILLNIVIQPIKHELKEYVMTKLTDVNFPYSEMLGSLSLIQLKRLTSFQVLNLLHCLLSLAEPHYAKMRFEELCVCFKIIVDLMNCLDDKIDENHDDDACMESEKMSCILQNGANENADNFKEMCFDLVGTNYSLSNRLKEFLDLEITCMPSSKIILYLSQIFYYLNGNPNQSHYSFVDVLQSSPIFLREIWEIVKFPSDDKSTSFLSKISSKAQIKALYTFCNMLELCLSSYANLNINEDYSIQNLNSENSPKLFDGLLDISDVALFFADRCMQMNFLISTSYGNNEEFGIVLKEAIDFTKYLCELNKNIKFMDENNWAVHSLKAAYFEQYWYKLIGYTKFMKDDIVDVLLPVIASVGDYEQKVIKYDALRYEVKSVFDELPFIFTFESRYEFFMKSRKILPKVNKALRFTHLYEDAFQFVHRIKDFKKPKDLCFFFVDIFGRKIPGGWHGQHKEAVNVIIMKGFNPDFGLFKGTSEGFLCPDPLSEFLKEDYLKHYYFLGKILGLAIKLNFTFDLPFADFFLNKLLGKNAVDFDHMSSLDSALYKSLIYLRDTDDVESMELYFNIEYDVQGSLKSVDLKPNGSNILVANDNKHEYISLFVDWHLNKRITKHCNAFLEGLDSVITTDDLRLFDRNELQFIISGSQAPIDVHDLRKHTFYIYDCHIVYPELINNFWSVFHEMTETQKEDMLRFVTNSRRPPPFGFEKLENKFSIVVMPHQSMPGVSTCTNVLQLPACENLEILKEKLLSVIDFGTGLLL